MKETKGLSTEDKKWLYRSKSGRPGKLDNYENMTNVTTQREKDDSTISDPSVLKN